MLRGPVIDSSLRCPPSAHLKNDGGFRRELNHVHGGSMGRQPTIKPHGVLANNFALQFAC
jgi:hypothetical protein